MADTNDLPNRPNDLSALPERDETTFDRTTERLGTAVLLGLMTGGFVASAMLACYVVVIAAGDGMTEGMALCLSFVAAGLAGGILQQLWFNFEPAILRLRVPVRYAGFALTYYACLLACAWLGRWFPVDAGHLTGFSLIFLVLFAVISVAFALQDRRRALEYDRKLREYRERNAG